MAREPSRKVGTFYPCPCCGYLKFTEPPGTYEICDICGWEDDHVQLHFPEHRGGANGESLMEAQQAYAQEAAKRSPTEPDPTLGETRDPLWRPYDPTRDRLQRQDNIRSGYDYFRAALEIDNADLQAMYYWRRGT